MFRKICFNDWILYLSLGLKWAENECASSSSSAAAFLFTLVSTKQEQSVLDDQDSSQAKPPFSLLKSTNYRH
jgi:hypothetical protein